MTPTTKRKWLQKKAEYGRLTYSQMSPRKRQEKLQYSKEKNHKKYYSDHVSSVIHMWHVREQKITDFGNSIKCKLDYVCSVCHKIYYKQQIPTK